MGKVADDNGPVLGRIRILVDLLGDQLPQAGVLGEPLPGAADGMPSDLDGPGPLLEFRFGDGDDIGGLTQADGLLDSQLALVDALETIFLFLQPKFGEPVGLVVSLELSAMYSSFRGFCTSNKNQNVENLTRGGWLLAVLQESVELVAFPPPCLLVTLLLFFLLLFV